jgi:hypothetical protein
LLFRYTLLARQRNIHGKQHSRRAFMVILVETLSRGISLNKVCMSSIEQMETPTLPTHPPQRDHRRHNQFVWEDQTPPTNRFDLDLIGNEIADWILQQWRNRHIALVHNRPRYMFGWMPRVYGYSPGKPSG